MTVPVPAADGESAAGGASYRIVTSPIAALLIVLPAIAAVIAAVVTPDALSSPVDAAASLALITGAAVGIERALEVFWTVIGSSKTGQWWPFSAIGSAFAQYERDANDLFEEPLADVLGVLDEAAAAAIAAGDDIAAVTAVVTETRAEADRIRARYEAAKKNLPVGSGRLQVISEAVDDTASFVDHVIDQAKAISDEIDTSVSEAVNAVTDSCKEMTDVIQSFDDNPARKLASLSFGVSAGMLVAAVLGTNMFSAILDNADDLRLALDGTVGVLVTGIVIGLGSNPTHEAIKALERRRADRAATVPEAPTVLPSRAVTPRLTVAASRTWNLVDFDPVPLAEPAPPEVRLSVPVSPKRNRRVRSTS